MSVRMTGVPPTRCPECEGRLRPVGTELVCEECSLVTEGDVIDHGPEWRSFDRAERKRTGAPLTRSRHDRGLSTRIGSGSSIRVTGRKRRQLARMRREQARARFETKADYNRMTGFTEIRRIVSQLSLPGAVREQACTLFESAQTEDLLIGRSLEGFAAAVVYATCRTRDIARTREEILEISRADGDELAAAYAALNRELGLPTGPIDPVEYLPRYASRLDLDNGVERRAERYARDLAEAGVLGGRNPSGVAAACLYAAARRGDCESITQATAADVAGVSPVTVRSTVEEIRALESGDADADERKELDDGGRSTDD
ncbi:transcription initiation factor IIB family protein [Saliphagus sp. LR7]|uniref:transcription initiation factor IIB n=1 Tax=Saliphagus sp. LR7 TaxID=2282654 RepID=UPI001E4421DF|nr:transcription initiation factor IIB family protein [Saliphagus sp. LR7]